MSFEDRFLNAFGQQPTLRACPHCGESIQLSAKKCRYCGKWIEKPSESKVFPKDRIHEEENVRSTSRTRPLHSEPQAMNGSGGAREKKNAIWAERMVKIFSTIAYGLIPVLALLTVQLRHANVIHVILHACHVLSVFACFSALRPLHNLGARLGYLSGGLSLIGLGCSFFNVGMLCESLFVAYCICLWVVFLLYRKMAPSSARLGQWGIVGVLVGYCYIRCRGYFLGGDQVGGIADAVVGVFWIFEYIFECIAVLLLCVFVFLPLIIRAFWGCSRKLKEITH